MEEIYQPKRFVCTEYKQMKDYFQQFTNNLSLDDKEFMLQHTVDDVMPQIKECNLNEAIFSFINDDTLDENARDELAELCSPNLLKIPEERAQITMKNIFGAIRLAKRYKPYDVVPEALHLQTVKNCEKKYVHHRQENIFRDEILNPNEFDFAESSIPRGNTDLFLVPGKDFVVFVRFFRPYQSNYSLDNFKARTYVKFDQEIVLSSQNTLADLRDKIICVANQTTLTDISDDVGNFSKVEYAMDKYPSSFIFIDGVFYNDYRDPRSKDYSGVIRKWALDRNVGTFKVSEQDKVEIGNLTPRFGYPYVFQHHGRCEHVFFFSQARFVSPEDNLKQAEYPYINKVANSKCVYCYICGTSVANWVIIDCDRLPDDKSPLCDVCFKSYCYVNETKIGSFKAFPFLCKKVALCQAIKNTDQQITANDSEPRELEIAGIKATEEISGVEGVNIKIELYEAKDIDPKRKKSDNKEDNKQ